MASTHRRTLTAGDPTALPILLLLSLLVTARCVQAQSPPPPGRNINGPYFTNPNFKPSVAIVVAVVFVAFFFVAFFSIYFGHCVRIPDNPAARTAAAAAAARSRRQRGLGDDVISTFPTLVYSEVKEHKAGKGALECAVCLSEFEDDETLRLLPKCDHVFHPDCIDAWLAAHVTCPVCRTNLVPDPNEPSKPDGGDHTAAPPAEHVIEVDRMEEEEEVHRQVQADLERIINMKRAKSRARPVSIPRSNTTGHSLVRPGDNLDRFTLRLPESVRNEINLRRARSFAVPVGEGSSRMWLRRENNGSINRTGRSIRLGRSDRWPSVLLRTVSMKVAAWGRRDEPGGSLRGGGGSVRGGKGAVAAVLPLDCLGKGSNGREEEKNCHGESSTSACSRS